MDEQRLAGREQFERHRPHLRAVAYRMLGSISDADDAVQEAWIRLSRLGDRQRREPRRLADDRGRPRLSRHASRTPRPARGLRGLRLPEPIVGHRRRGDPEHEAMLADAVGLALSSCWTRSRRRRGSRSCCTTCSRSRSRRSLRSSAAAPRGASAREQSPPSSAGRDPEPGDRPPRQRGSSTRSSPPRERATRCAARDPRPRRCLPYGRGPGRRPCAAADEGAEQSRTRYLTRATIRAARTTSARQRTRRRRRWSARTRPQRRQIHVHGGRIAEIDLITDRGSSAASRCCPVNLYAGHGLGLTLYMQQGPGTTQRSRRGSHTSD